MGLWLTEGRKMLCFEVSKNGEKLAVAGVRESGVVSFMLSWVGKGVGASGQAAAAKGAIPGLNCHVGGIDCSDPAGNETVEWIEKPKLRIGDELRVRLVAAESADKPCRRETAVPVSRIEDGARVIQCSFCGEMRQTERKSWFEPGVAGASVFICTRCLILSERMLHDSLDRFVHLTRAMDQECSFCGTKRTTGAAMGNVASMCRACVDMMMT
jgi:hypothetical protein